MLISIVIINYNTFQLTCNCISSIIKYVEAPYEIILVDNCSTKDDPNEFVKIFPTIKLVKNPVNNGFAKGNNLGIAHTSGNIILLLNSDTYLLDDGISKPAEILANSEFIGALGIKLLYEDGKYQHSARKFRSIRNEILDLLRPVLWLIPYKQRARIMLNQYFKGDFSIECDWMMGAYMMFKKAILNDLPEKKLDERFFMYGEDQLWCYQITQAGYKNYYNADNSIIHIANASTEPTKQLKLLKLFVKHENVIMAYRKGKGLYYYIFKCIYTSKDYLRYYIKTFVQKNSTTRLDDQNFNKDFISFNFENLFQSYAGL